MHPSAFPNRPESQERARQKPRAHARARIVRLPQAASEEVARLVLVPGLETVTGAPVLALATGPARRPVLQVIGARFATLAAARPGGDI